MIAIKLSLIQKRDLRLAKAAGLNVTALQNENGAFDLWTCSKNEEKIGDIWAPEKRIDEAFLVANQLGLIRAERTKLIGEKIPAWRAVFRTDGREMAAIRPTLAEALTDGCVLVLDATEARDRTDEKNAAVQRCWTREAYMIEPLGDDRIVTTRRIDDVSDLVQVRIEPVEKGFILHDDGHVANECFLSGHTIDSRVFSETVRQIARRIYGLNIAINRDLALALAVDREHDLPETTNAFSGVISLACQLLAHGLSLNASDTGKNPL